ncbi:hypothetical protein X766_33380 [Mesorhizobium sp. LSJC255A00]|nr:hypothetical protein X766_33380 [Mesorhizobium sp. LSJC255A00]
MTRRLLRRKRTFFAEAVPAFDCVRPLSGRLADPLLPPMLIQTTRRQFALRPQTMADSLQTPTRRIGLR